MNYVDRPSSVTVQKAIGARLVTVEAYPHEVDGGPGVSIVMEHTVGRNTRRRKIDLPDSGSLELLVNALLTAWERVDDLIDGGDW